MKKQSNKKKGTSPYIRFTSVAFQMGATIYFGNFLGGWLDSKYNKTFWENSITLLAVFLSMYLVISQVLKLSKEND